VPDVWVWAAFGLLLALLGARAWVVETGYATLGRTPVTVKVLTGACALGVALVVGLVTVDGGAELVGLLLDPAAAAAAQEAAEDAADASTAPPPVPATVEPPPAAPAPSAAPSGAPSAAPTTPAVAPAPAGP
jgi:hypothetical protein